MDHKKPMHKHKHGNPENAQAQKKSSHVQHPRAQMPPPTKRPLPDDMDNISNRPTKRSKDPAAAPRKAESGLEKPTQHLAINKRPRPDGDLDGHDQAKPLKRAKVDQEHTLPPDGSARIPSPPHAPSTRQDQQPLPAEVQHLSSKYDITTMSIISSSKLEHKIRNLLDRVGRFSFAEPKAKPGVVVLHAKAEVASKMISIVEIAKKEIEKEQGKWWQYSKLEGQMVEMKKRKKQQPSSNRTGCGKTLGEWVQERGRKEGAGVDEEDEGEEEGEGEEEEEVEGIAKAAAGRAAATPDAQQKPCSTQVDNNNNDIDNDDDDDNDPSEAFETMAPPPKLPMAPPPPAPEQSRPKIRNTPLMTIYIARVPVPGLKQLYGEQTNALD